MSLEANPPGLIQQDLYFERNLPGGGEVSEIEFQRFVDNVITTRFPAGLTIFDADEQLCNDKDTPEDESTRIVTLFVEDSSANEVALDKIAKAYHQQFQGAAVTQVTNQDDLKVGFDVAEDLIHNDPVPELIQVDLFFGRNIAGIGEVSEAEFETFVDNVITPHFPDGLTVFDANGYFEDSKGEIVAESSKVVSLILEDTETNEKAIDEIVEAYIEQFQQESVLQAVNEDVTVSFEPTDNLIDNDSIPEPIQVDLFFGRDIAGVGEVSEEQFQEFIDDIVTPRFSKLTVFDTEGQFKDSTGAIAKEPSKVISLILEDTETNETAINDIVEQYIQQFRQESVLIVVDEEIQAEGNNASCAYTVQPGSGDATSLCEM
jgi:hypothetical protein